MALLSDVYISGSTFLYKCLDPITLIMSNHSEVKFDEELFLVTRLNVLPVWQNILHINEICLV